jgi:hypothetical protein
MAKYLAQIQAVQSRVSSLLKRLEQAETNALSTEWPHSALKDSVREYVRAVALSARAAAFAATSALQLQRRLVHEPVTLLNDQRLQRHFRSHATKNNVGEDEVAKAAFAYAETHIRIGAQVVAHLEACIEGTQTIEGRVIARGKMWDK